jgi:hypothetical protein
MTTPDEEVTAVVLRFRDLITAPGETLARHRELCDRYGFTWWGWWNRVDEIVPYPTFTFMKYMFVTRRTFSVFLFDTASDSLYEAKCNDIHFSPAKATVVPSPQPEATPEYYRNQQYLAWFKFSSIATSPIPESTLVDHLSYANVPAFAEAARKEDSRFADKTVASVREMRRQGRTLFFLKHAAATHARQEIVEPLRIQVFLCHSSSDKERVRQLYTRLKADGFTPWLDEENLLPGQDWQFEILKAVKESDVVLVCLSVSSVTKEGFVQKEIKFALDIADEKPEGAIFIVPVRLEECNVPPRLSRWQYVNLYTANGYSKLLAALRARAAVIAARETVAAK